MFYIGEYYKDEKDQKQPEIIYGYFDEKENLNRVSSGNNFGNQ
jgi:hypothetical protein